MCKWPKMLIWLIVCERVLEWSENGFERQNY